MISRISASGSEMTSARVIYEQPAPRAVLDEVLAYDLYRLLVDTATDALASKFRTLLLEEISGEVTAEAQVHLGELFASGPDAIGSMMAGRTEEGIGEPETVARQVVILMDDLLKAIDR